MVGNPTLADHRPDVVSAGVPRALPRWGVGGCGGAASGPWLRAEGLLLGVPASARQGDGQAPAGARNRRRALRARSPAMLGPGDRR